MGWFTKDTPEEIAKSQKLAAETAAKINAWAAQFETPESTRQWEKDRFVKKITSILAGRSYVVLEGFYTVQDLEKQVNVAIELGYTPVGAVQVDTFFSKYMQAMTKIG